MIGGVSESLPPGTIFGVYRIQRLIGRGGMGSVYEAVHTGLNKRVAIKTVTAQVASNQEHLRRFLREGETAARIRHANVVDITDVGVHEGLPYLVMEYLEGEDLADLLARERALSVSRTVDILLPVMAGICAAHDEGVVHRDLKPQNIFLAKTRQGQVQPKLLDFGISKISDARSDGKTLTRTSSLLGTPFYMSPEQVKDAKLLDARTDQYSLAVIFYECLSGQRPFSEERLYPLLNRISRANVRACAPSRLPCPRPSTPPCIARSPSTARIGSRACTRWGSRCCRLQAPPCDPSGRACSAMGRVASLGRRSRGRRWGSRRPSPSEG